MNRSSEYLYLIPILLMVVFVFLGLGFEKIGYYNQSDFFGPFSRYLIFFLIASFLPALALVLTRRNPKISLFALLLPLLLLIILKYAIPDLMETNYVTNFSDAPVHLKKGLFVTKTGFSDPFVDGYFDLQPGFFWVTAMVLNLGGAIPSSIMSPVSLFLTKWFHLFMIVAYIPILYVLYRKLLHSISLVGLALVMHFALDFGHYHYAAQSYANLLFWLYILLILMISRKRDRRLFVLFLLSCFALIFLHQGLTFFVIVLTGSTLFVPFIFKSVRKITPDFLRRYLLLFIILLVGWSSYLVFNTIYTFGDFARILRDTVRRLTFENFGLLSASILRPNAAWMEVVTSKAVYLAFVVLLGLVLSLINARRSGDIYDKMVFTMQLFSATFIGGLALTLGGAGYIERLVVMLPLIVYSILKFVTSVKWHTAKSHASLAGGAFLVVMILAGMTFYFSGRNFQSMTFSELSGQDFIVQKDASNIAGFYSRIVMTSVSTGMTYGLEAGVYYYTSLSDGIYSIYYQVGESSKLQDIYSNLSRLRSQIYDNSVMRIVAPSH